MKAPSQPNSFDATRKPEEPDFPSRPATIGRSVDGSRSQQLLSVPSAKQNGRVRGDFHARTAAAPGGSDDVELRISSSSRKNNFRRRFWLPDLSARESWHAVAWPRDPVENLDLFEETALPRRENAIEPIRSRTKSGART